MHRDEAIYARSDARGEDPRIAAVLALHRQIRYSDPWGRERVDCGECNRDWPCATVRAIEAAS